MTEQRSIQEAAEARGWRLEVEESGEFPFCWFRPDGRLFDCFQHANDLPIKAINECREDACPK